MMFDHDAVTFYDENFFPNLFFLENYNKQEDMSYEFPQSVSLTKDLSFSKYPFWLILLKNSGNAKQSTAVQYTPRSEVSM